MDRAIYIAMSGAKNVMQSLNTNNNNLANINTPGFRADLINFKSGVVQGDGFAGRVYGEFASTNFDATPGPIVTTSRPLDAAIKGDGYFTVQSSTGTEALTRNGNFHIDSNGLLQTTDGHIVLGNQGPITIPPAEKIIISKDGTVSIQPVGQTPENLAVVDQLKLVNPEKNSLRKGEDGLIYTNNGGTTADPTVRLTSGALESSNVNPIDALVKMIEYQQMAKHHFNMMNKLDEQADASVRMVRLDG